MSYIGTYPYTPDNDEKNKTFTTAHLRAAESKIKLLPVIPKYSQ